MKILRSILLIAAIQPLHAELKLPSVFSDHMVLQRDVPTPVWGWAEPGQEVRVSFAGKTVTTSAAEDGSWSVKLPESPANATPGELKVTADETLSFSDVLVGDVWICSGQSNMEWPLRRCTKTPDEVVAPHQDNTQLRLFNIPKHIKLPEPATDAPGAWTTTANADACLGFSGCGFFFGSKLQQELDIPIGLIGTNWGGTPVDQWISNKAHREVLGSERKGASIYNGMIAPLVPFAIKGAIWYQGESNRGNAFPAYFEKMKALIAGWREDFAVGDFPFYQVQIAPFRYNKKKPGDDETLARNIWASQFKAADEIPGCGIVPIHDTIHGVITNIHPWDKQPVGERLALLALKKDYGKDVPHTGPTFASAKAGPDGKVVVAFDFIDQGLTTSDGGDPVHFEVAAEDRKFVPAEATIKGETAVVHSDEVTDPKFVRMGWNETQVPNLADKNGWPAFQFGPKEIE